MSNADSDITSDSSSESADRFEDIFVHHLSEIEQVWQDLNIARAKTLKVRPDSKRPAGFSIKYPIKLSAIQNVSNQELQNMRDNEEGIDGTAEGVANGLEKEAGVLLSFMSAMFIENLMIKTMYHLPQEKALGFRRTTQKIHLQPTQTSGSPDGIQLPNIALKPSEEDLMKALESYSLTISREDVRRALLRDEMCDFLVQSGLAQPEGDVASMVAEMDESSRDSNLKTDRLHLGYWKILERTFSGLEMGGTGGSTAASSSSSASLHYTPTHTISSLSSKLMMKLTPESDSSHARFTIFPENEDMESNHVEFSLEMIPNDSEYLKLTGRVRVGHLDIVMLEGKIASHFTTSGDLGSSPMDFSWAEQNEQDAAFPIVGRRTSAQGRGSVQLMDKASAALAFPESAQSWLSSSPFGILSLDLIFELGDTGFLLHNHYLCIPIFVQPPAPSQ
jgi:hypothetical protein